MVCIAFRTKHIIGNRGIVNRKENGVYNTVVKIDIFYLIILISRKYEYLSF